MDLQISVFLLFILFTAGHTLNCYECFSVEGSCADQKVRACPEHSTCFSSTTILNYGNFTKHKIKGCVPSSICVFTNSGDISSSCCNTDLCNAKDAPDPPGDSGLSDLPYFPSIPGVSNVPDYPSDPNGKKCHYCVGQNCSNIMSCSGNADYCFTASGKNFQGSSFNLKGCLSKAYCDSLPSNPYIQSVSCCSGNLCNSAKSVTQSFLFLCCSLLSFILMH